VVVAHQVVVVVVVVGGTAAFTVNEAAEPFQSNIDVHAAPKTPTFTE
jgi:hypothetical protein